VKAYVATKNADKLRELRVLFAGSELELDVYPDYEEVEEDATDYAGNARLKALRLRSQLVAAGTGGVVLADDSGIEVDALGGRPGVRSARYGGDISWPERLKMLLAEVDGVPDDRRGARFFCAMALVCDDGPVIESEGDVRGVIAREPIGSNGFGYDPIFYYPPLQKTFGEISEEEKNRLSHRYRAAQRLLAALRSV